MSTLAKVLLSSLIVLSFPAQALAEIDGKSSLICAILDVNDCSSESGCAVGDNESLNLPDFVRVDFAKKMITASDTEDSSRKTVIQSVNQSDEGFLLQGSGLGRGWTISLNKNDGEFALAATGNGLSFIAFGVCTED
jgi:hypothetical protein